MEINRRLIAMLQAELWDIDIMFGISQLNQALFNMSLGNFDPKEARKAYESFTIDYNSGQLVEVSGDMGAVDGSQKYIRVMNLVGTMFTEDQYCGPKGIRSMVNEMYDTYSNPNYAGILIYGNTGGGMATAGQMLNSAMKDKNKPVVVHATMLASAGIMGTIHATEIVGDIISQFGSIGSYLSIDKEMLEKYKEVIDDIYAEQSVNKNIEIREYIKGNRGPIQNYINAGAQTFIDSVKPKLKGDKDTIKETLSGGMFSAKDAKARGLIDSIGTRAYALKRLKAHTNY